MMSFLTWAGEHPVLGVTFALIATVNFIVLVAMVGYSIIGPALAKKDDER